MEGGVSYRWRRVVFEVKGVAFENTSTETSSGMVRSWRPMTTLAVDALVDRIFKGRPGTDTISYFLAATDKDQVKIHLDQTRVFNGGNQNGYGKFTKHYIPFERRMIYDSDENGDEMEQATKAAQGRTGMGDVYIYDIFQDVGAPTGVMNFISDSTLYWHEK